MALAWRSSTRSCATIRRATSTLSGLLRRVDRQTDHQRHGRAARDRAPARLRAERAHDRLGMHCAASLLLAVRCVRRKGLGTRGGVEGGVHAARGSARRVGTGSRPPSRHRARRHRNGGTDPTLRLAARCAASATAARRSRTRCGSARHERPASTAGRSAKPAMVRPGRHAVVLASLAREAGGLHAPRTCAASR